MIPPWLATIWLNFALAMKLVLADVRGGSGAADARLNSLAAFMLLDEKDMGKAFEPKGKTGFRAGIQARRTGAGRVGECSFAAWCELP
jgi:hypothetical protein